MKRGTVKAISWDWDQARRELVATDPRLAPVLAATRPPVFRDAEPIAHLARSVCAQQLSVKAANTIEGRLRAACGGEITAKALAALSEARLREIGLSRAKATSLAALARAGLDGTLAAHTLRELADAEVVSRLSALPGIGRWTAEVFLLFALRRPDVLPADDLGLRDAAARMTGDAPGPLTAAALRHMAEPWRPWRSAAAIGLWAWRHTLVPLPQSRTISKPS